ncbi:MAG: hypothetical protein H6626_04815 [Pseudobdellovibrionaceae bacterium]|nr:hypothetical protein [Bdellovibrionales bacterium]USN48413.1 MAG: hypothetical protein H6626_04815 [Pseudobdellovibrionaceae bacterium]
MKRLLVFLAGLIYSAVSFAAAPSFTSIDGSDLEKIVGDFTSNFAFTSVSPASSLGTVFGVEVGVLAGLSQTPGVNDLAKQVDPNADIAGIPHLNLLAAVSVPMGITGEINYFPSMDSGDFNMSNLGLAVKWTMTDSILSLPLDLALRLHYTNSELKFSQTVNSVATDVEYASTSYGLTAVASRSFVVIEPYAGLGFISASGDVSLTNALAVADFFDPSLTSGTSASASKSGMQYFVGAQLNLLLFRLAAEVGQVLDSTKYTAKLSFKF